MYYTEIQKLFGTPLMQIPLPNAPFKMKTWQLIAGATILGLAAYGGYCLYNRFTEDQTQIVNYKLKNY